MGSRRAAGAFTGAAGGAADAGGAAGACREQPLYLEAPMYLKDVVSRIRVLKYWVLRLSQGTQKNCLYIPEIMGL